MVTCMGSDSNEIVMGIWVLRADKPAGSTECAPLSRFLCLATVGGEHRCQASQLQYGT